MVTASTSAAFLADKQLKDLLYRPENKTDLKWEIPRYWGEPITSITLSALLLLEGHISGKNNEKVAFDVITSFLNTGFATTILKFGIGRYRPYTDSSNTTFTPFSSLEEKNLSLPSGHTSVAFSLSTILSKHIKNNSLKLLVFLPAIATGLSRMAQNYHWFSDVVLGACLGYFIAEFVYSRNNENMLHSPPPPQINIQFSF